MKTIRTVLLMLFTVPLLVFGQGVISRITLSAPGLELEIVDEKARNDFGVGGGPGNTLNGMPNWKPNSWIVEDWLHPVAEPDQSLRRVKATFTIDRGSARGARTLYSTFTIPWPNRASSTCREGASRSTTRM